MISDMLAQISAMKDADDAKLVKLEEKFRAAMGVIESMREWCAHANHVNEQAVRAAEIRLEEVLRGDA